LCIETLNNSTSAQIINVLLRQTFLGVDNIFFTEHPNMLVNGIPNKDLLQPDVKKKKQKQKLSKEIPSVPLNNCSIIIINSFQ
jgi:hypothetical protein